ncbi:amino acid adenylation domain-containing protein [Kutzneria sp. NPDC051319]|uniref:non-ribosomal peptide synthetase n=1 Tax=Kutzneria sp. NPDC051319 TaxID=3155047 RepID=UPI00341CE231
MNRGTAAAAPPEFRHDPPADADSSPVPGPGAAGTPDEDAVHLHLTIPADQVRRLADIAQRHTVPLPALIVATHVRVLGSVTSNAHVTAVVQDADAANPIPIGLNLSSLTWIELARQVVERETESARREATRHQRPPAVHPDTLVSFGRARSAGNPLAGHRCETGPFAFAVDVTVGDELAIDMTVDPRRVHSSVVDRLVGYYERALALVAGDPLAVATTAEIRSSTDLARLPAWSVGPAEPLKPFTSVPELVHRHAVHRPAELAVCDADTSLDYAEFDRRVNRLANHLRSLGVKRGNRVGVCVHRGVELVVTLVAVLATGAAYVPLDPDFPPQRLDFIAQDADLVCLIVGSGITPPSADVRLVSLDDDRSAIESALADATSARVEPHDAAYVIYTSGTTGRPKGTVVEHANVANLFAGMDRLVGIHADDRFLSVTSVSFDISVLEMVWPLASGASTFIAPERVVEYLADNRRSLGALARQFRPSLFQATPSLFTALAIRPQVLAALSGLRALLVGGEALSRSLADTLTRALPHVRVFNMYGPTETTVWSTAHELDHRAEDTVTVPIGRPIANTRLVVVDGLGNEACVGVSGELWIGGEGVAAGYHRRPDLESERFVENAEPASGRYYRTGDQVRWRDDGRLDFLGRDDRQVKILGHRVELDEIEGVLSEHPDLAAAAVTYRHHPERGHELIAHLQPAPGRTVRERQRLDRWQRAWDASYVKESNERFPGWVDNYTGAPFPVDVMEQWRAAWTNRVRRLAPRRIIDIGSGTGLLVRSLGGQAESYLAIDASGAALDAARSLLGELADPARVDLRVGDALTLRELPDASADVVVLNSVVQYFPSTDYLTRVLDEAIRVAGRRGAVFVGDVRDARLLRMFHADVELWRAKPLTPASDLRAAVEHLVRGERELCLSRSFFDSLVQRHDGVTVLAESKTERTRTVMSCFRWDVTIVGPDSPAALWTADAAVRSAWRPDEPDALEGLSTFVAAIEANGSLLVTDVPNARLSKPRAVLHALETASGDATAWDIARAVWDVATDGAADPADLVDLGARHRVITHVGPARSGRPDHIDITFRRLS